MPKYPIVKILFDRRKLASDKKKGSFEIEVAYGDQRVRFSTGIRVFKKQYKNGNVINCLEAVELNKRLATIKEATERKVNEMMINGCVNLAELKVTPQTINIDMFEWIKERIYTRPIRSSTRKQHIVMLNNLKHFGKIKTFSDLTVSNLKQWDDYIKKHVNTQTSVHGYHKRLKPYINEAILFGYMQDNPYSKFRVERGKADKILYLTDEERKRIEDLEVAGGLEIVKDMFLFACYTGLAYSDMIKVNKDDVQDIDYEKYIIDKRLKTGSPYKLKLLPPALKILEKYDYNLNRMTNQKCNFYLKIIANNANIKKNVTMHVGRHTFATWALSKGVRLEVVSKMLAHSDIKTTQTYAKILQEDVDKGFDLLGTKL